MSSGSTPSSDAVPGDESLPAVSVVVVNFEAGPRLTQAVLSALGSAIVDEVIVVDNASTDDSLAELRRAAANEERLRIVQNPRNLGFAAAANAGLRQARSDLLVLLNPDCLLTPDALPRLARALMADPAAGMAGGLVRNPDGTEQSGARRLVPTPGRAMVRVLHLNRLFKHHPRFQGFDLAGQPLPPGPQEAEAISGALMLVRRQALDAVGPLDEGYFLHCEDLDWCMRFHLGGWKILFVPDAQGVHYQGTCSAGRPVRVLYHKHRGMARYYGKFFRRHYPRALTVLALGTVWLRFGLLAVWTGIFRPRRARRAGAEPVSQTEAGGRPAKGSGSG